MRIDIITLFPDIFFGPLSESIIGRANEQKLVDIRTINLRDFTTDKRKSVDDLMVVVLECY
jgi:tRNA (guanine37-N1)-methyltransferase